MLRELGAFVEALQRELELKGCKATDVQVEVKCRSILEWTVLDQAVEREIRADHPELWRRRQYQFDRVIVPHMLTYKDTPVRITYER
jgi:hypothetical protein